MNAALAIVLVVLVPQRAPGLLVEGSAVHPGCIRELTTELADSMPVVAGIDIVGCRDSNEYASEYETSGQVLRWRDPTSTRGAYFQYEYLGSLSNGVHVVMTADSGGGSGIFQSLLFLRVGQATVLEDGKPRVRQMLTLVGSESVGDRAEVTVQLSGESVTIKRREFRGAMGLGPEEVVVRTVR
jgi:hypothetical protein